MKYLNKLAAVASAFFFFASAALAQNSGTVTNHAFAIGKGAGTTGYTSLLCGSAQLAVGQAAADPICKTITGDWTLSAAGAATLATVNANVGSFGGATSCPAFTVNGKGLITAASAVTCTPAFSSITGTEGIDANILNAKTANYTIANTDCGKTIQAGTGSTGLFTITLPSVSGFSTTCTVTVVNGDTGRGKKLSGFPTTMTSSSMLWPGQGVTAKIVNGAWVVPQNPGRWKVPNNTTVYMDVINGNDANDCLAAGSGNACATFAQVIRKNIKDYYDLSGTSSFPTATITVQLADNQTSTGACTTCYALAHIAFTAVGGEGRNTILIQGNASTPGNTIISDAGGVNIGAYGGGVAIELRNLQIGQTSCGASPKANAGPQSADGASVRLEGGVVLGCVTDAQISALNGGKLISDGAISVTGGGNYFAFLNLNGFISLNGQTVTFSNSPTYSQQTVAALGMSMIDLGGVTWTNGGTVTATEYFCRANSVIETDTGSGASIPGATGGSAGSGCQVF